MKKLTLAVLALAAAATSAEAKQLQALYADDQSAFFVDTEIDEALGFPGAWYSQVLSERSKQGFDIVQTYLEIDCENGLTRARQAMFFNSDFRMVDSNYTKEDWTPVASKPQLDAFARYVCDDETRYPGVVIDGSGRDALNLYRAKLAARKAARPKP
ncbi:hypothetical protein [Caulobacter sp. 17J80-11]|uniref:hypothetical protein n=1 Tax=Caulobacter sp. 17J80-11 TaxID=2763502 RepID=UPI001653DB3E|nr:hypothetical protein [Caulobacter sp. 17J80-11]MBC6982158.1 hypothetical protein [Caulobacter sp. 17J80-11]